jgi:hypothetical protein
MELHGLHPNFHIHVSFSEYMPTIGLPSLLQESTVCGLILGIYKALADAFRYKLGLRPSNSFSGNT